MSPFLSPTIGLGQTVQQNVSILYPQLLTTQFIHCKCLDVACQTVFWFRTLPGQNKVQYLGRFNIANRIDYADNVDVNRFLFNKKNTDIFTLQIINVTKEDTGTYSCFMKDRRNNEEWLAGALLLPGADDCDSLILWALVGLVTVLMTTLFCTLYYFSRLPKKCRHQFVK
nr:T cell receptor beta variable 20-1 [Nerophis lumbriciformis]